MDQSWWTTRVFKRYFLIMKIKLELFGASRDFSNKDYLEFDIKQKIEIKDFRKEIINYLENNFKGNESFVKIVKNSVFCSEDNNIVNDSFKIIKDQKIAIIPPIGGGWCYIQKL